MRRSLLALTILAALPAAALAQTAPAPAPAGAPAAAALPDNAIGRLARRLLDAIDSGDSAAVARFAAEHLGRDPRGRSPAAMASLLARLQAQSGGLRVERARMAGGALRVMAQARNGRRWLGMELEPATGDTTRIASVLTLPMDDPGPRLGPTPWSTDGTLGDDAVAALVRARVRQAADSDRFSGVVLVAHGDRVLVHEAYGFADRERGLRNALDTPHPTYSLGKMFTAVAVAQLVAEGKLRFDDTLATVLPEYPNRDAARRITIRQLLTHTAGVPDPFLSARFDRAREYASHREMLADFADAPLNANAGRSFDYSNGGFATLAAVVERVSGMGFEEYLRRRVWGPAGMAVRGGTPAVGYARFSELDPLGVEPRRPETVRGGRRAASHRERAYGFGGGDYTAEDLFRFARALRTGKLLPAALADTITTGKVTMGGPMRYAFGFFDQPMHGRRVVGHSGSNPDTGHDADLEMVWDGEWTVVVLSNYDAPAGMQVEMSVLDLVARQR